MNLSPITSFSRHLLSELYWSRVGAPLRQLLPKATRPPEDRKFWDAQVSGPLFSKRLGDTLSIDTRNQTIAMLLKHNFPHGRIALDIGCAGGTLAPVLVRQRDYFRYVGVDISRAAITDARLRAREWNLGGRQVEFQEGTAESFVTVEGFDLIILSEILYYVGFSNVLPVLQRLFWNLRPNGIFCISLNLGNPKSRAIQRLIAPHLDYIAGTIQQEKTAMDDRQRTNRERPAYHTFLARMKA